MFNKVARLSPAFQGYTLYELGGDLRNFTTMQIVSQGANYYSNNGSPLHSLNASEMKVGWENQGYFIRVGGWDVRFNINLSSVPERARYGKIGFSAPASYASMEFGYDDPDKLGRTQYRNSSGSYLDILPAYGAGSGEGKHPGDCSFITADTVNDYIENQGGILQLRLLHTGDTSFYNSWYAPSYVYDDLRVTKIEIVGA